MPEKRRILFVCTGNACRSQMAEGLLRKLGDDRFEALSAGTSPAGFIHPLAIEAMARLDINLDNQHSKSLDEFAQIDVDAVITLCDAAAGSACPSWRGSPVSAHWSLPDPAVHPGTDEERTALALRVADRLHTKIQGLVELDWTAKPEELTQRLAFLGEI